MISYLKGTIYDITEEAITLLVQDSIGYEIFISTSDRANLKPKQETELFCYHYITERTQNLYGFRNLKHKTLFVLLAESVHGIGPKSALKILNKGSYETIIKAIKEMDIDALQGLGIGKKTAEKVIVALKDVLSGEKAHLSFAESSPILSDAKDALANLGYKNREISEILKNIDIGGKSVEQIVKEALKL